MAAKTIIFSPNAERELKSLTREAQKQIIRSLERWAGGEAKCDVEKIKTQPDFYRLKAGDYRIIYCPLLGGRVVLLLIRDRKEAYKKLPNLPAHLETAVRLLRLERG